MSKRIELVDEKGHRTTFVPERLPYGQKEATCRDLALRPEGVSVRTLIEVYGLTLSSIPAHFGALRKKGYIITTSTGRDFTTIYYAEAQLDTGQPRKGASIYSGCTLRLVDENDLIFKPGTRARETTKLLQTWPGIHFEIALDLGARPQVLYALIREGRVYVKPDPAVKELLDRLEDDCGVTEGEAKEVLERHGDKSQPKERLEYLSTETFDDPKRGLCYRRPHVRVSDYKMVAKNG